MTGPGPDGRFAWEDPLNLDDQLAEDERHIRDMARAYAQDKLMPRILEANRHEKFDRRIVNEMGELGMLGSTLHGYSIARTPIHRDVWRTADMRHAYPCCERKKARGWGEYYRRPSRVSTGKLVPVPAQDRFRPEKRVKQI